MAASTGLGTNYRSRSVRGLAKSALSQLPECSFQYDVLLLGPPNQNIIREQLRVIHQGFYQSIGEWKVVDAQN
jgi:hypothetical protein